MTFAVVFGISGSIKMEIPAIKTMIMMLKLELKLFPGVAAGRLASQLFN